MSVYYSSSSYSGTASVTLYHANYWVVKFHPRTAAIRSIDSVPLYVSLLLRFPPSSIPVCRHSRGIQSSTPLHSAPLNPLRLWVRVRVWIRLRLRLQLRLWLRLRLRLPRVEWSKWVEWSGVEGGGRVNTPRMTTDRNWGRGKTK